MEDIGKSISRKANLVREIILKNNKDLKLINSDLDRLLNTVSIIYPSRQDYKDNFPVGDDIQAKINLYLTRGKN